MVERVGIAVTAGLFAIGCSFAGGSSGGDGDGNVDQPDAAVPVGAFVRDVVLTPPSSVTTTVVDAPVAIRLLRDDHLAAETRDDGGDLFALDQKGSQLPLEIETFDPDVGTLLAWVVVPELPPEGATITLHYGGDEIAPGNDINPWDGLAELVWHLTDLQGNVVLDSSPAAVHGARTNGNVTTVPGIFGGGLEFIDAAMSVDSDDKLDPGSESFTLSLWFNQLEAVGEDDSAFFKGGPVVNRPGYAMALGTGDWIAGARDDDGFLNSDEEYSVRFGDEAELGDSGWHHLVMVLDAPPDRMSAYLDGQLAEAIDTPSLSSLRNRDDVARAGGEADLLRGYLDEIRLINRPVSADWIAVDFANGIETLATVGEPQPSPL